MAKILIILGGPLTSEGNPGHHLIERLKRALEIHNRFDRIICTGTNTQKLGYTEAYVMSEWLLKRGVSCECEHFAKTTVENALFTRDLVSNKDTVSILTNSFHLPRTSLIFTRIWGDNFALEFISAPTTVQDRVTQVEPQHFFNFLTKVSPLSDSHFSVQKPPKLHQAIISGNIQKIWELLDQGADPYEKYKSFLYDDIELDAFDAVVRVNLSPAQVTVTILMLMRKCAAGVCFIRHGESIHNLLRYQGKVTDDSPSNSDTLLTENGISVSKEIGMYVSKYNLLDDFTVYVSPLTRAIETCKNIVPEKTRVLVSELLTEKVTHITDTGSPLSVLTKKYPDYTFDFNEEKWWYSESDTEPSEILEKRIRKFAKKIDLNKKTLVVTHGGFIRKAQGSLVRNCEARLSLIKKC